MNMHINQLMRVREKGFLDEWRPAFQDLGTHFSSWGTKKVTVSSKREKNNSLWTELRQPYPGKIHLLAITMETASAPLIIELRVWVYKGQWEFYKRLRNAVPPQILGKATEALLDQSPTSGFAGSVRKGGHDEIIGLIYRVRDLSFLGHDDLIRPSLRTVGIQFCDWVLANAEEDEDLAVVDGTAEAQQDVENDDRFAEADAKTRLSLVNARIGQGRYRTQVRKLWGHRCAVTGSDLIDILIASHAMPWKDGTIEDCLNPYNGLLLSPTLDKLFDQHLISFSDEGELLKSEFVTWNQLALHGVTPACKLRFICAEHVPYLSAHRLASRISA